MEETFERVTERHGAPAGAAARFRPGRAADRSELMNDNLVVDTSVLLDILLTNRPRHAEAVRLVPLLKNRTVHLPMHGMFELSSGLSSEKRKRGILPYNLLISENNPLTVKLIAIDEAFVQKYMTRDIARVSAGDMIFIALAKVDGLDLITEDDRMYKEALRLKVSVFTIAEYLLADAHPRA